MLVVHSPDHALHAPEQYYSQGVLVSARESPQRAEALLAGLRGDRRHEIIPPREHGLAPLRAAHDAEYLDFLRTAHAEWQARSMRGAYAVAQAYAVRQMQVRPKGFGGRLGYYLSSNSVPIGPGSWQAMLAAARCALTAADAVMEGAGEAYALCRPPGHHAYADMAGGFCYLNNAAIAALHLRARFGRVAVLDIDVHHGNGTQAIFYGRGDVHFVSLHADPNEAYPWYAGYAEERGEGDGRGHTLNLPLPLGAGDEAFLLALDVGIESIRGFAPDALVLSLGLDAYRDDPSDLLKVTTPGFAAIGARVGAMRRPTVLVQEGGYAVQALSDNLVSFLSGFLSARGRT